MRMQLRCRKCRNCRRSNQVNWINRAGVELATSARTWMVTLTYGPTMRAAFAAKAREVAPDGEGSPEWRGAILDAASRALTLWLKRLRKITGSRKVRYLASVEFHRDGTPHFHLLVHEVAGAILWRDFERASRGEGFLRAKLVKGSALEAARYVVKYLTKDEQVARVRASLHYGKLSVPVAPKAEQASEQDSIAPSFSSRSEEKEAFSTVSVDERKRGIDPPQPETPYGIRSLQVKAAARVSTSGDVGPAISPPASAGGRVPP